MNDHWDTITFQNLFAAPLRNGLTRPKSVRGQGTKMVNMGEIFAYSRIGNIDMDRVPLSENEALGYLLEPGDLLFARQSLVLSGAGKCSIILKQKEPVTFESHIIRARLNKSITDPIYYYYFFNSPMGRQLIESIVEQVAAAGIRGSDLARLKILYPPLPEQHAIARVLSTLDDKIELNRQMNKTLESMARTIFKSWFVDFDPVRYKMKGCKPFGMKAEAAALFPSNFTESSLGLIPEGWEVTTVEEIAQQVAMGPFGSDIKVSTFVSKGIPVISGQHLKDVMLTDNEFNFVTEEHAEKLKKANVKRGDVIFTHAGNIGQVSYIPEGSKFERYVLSQRQFYLRCNEEKMSPLFMVYFFKSPEGQHRLLANTSQTGVPSIARPVSYLRTIPFTKPPRKILDEFDKIILSLHRKILSNSKEMNNLSELRDLLLPRLLSGKLRVSEVKVKEAEKYAEALL